ncbi:EH signature domain-containing protein [Citrifermentans bremense]|uniref:EH signature domain-containing protein n=1 Tax=Citrifermentans bremense TaxID=60035 RepID=UPI00041E79A7|nr:EH signature domain-containing protein [Citrifermentans bremense]
MTVKHLDLLREELAKSLSLPLEANSWGRPELMQKALGRVRSAFDTAREKLPERSITTTVLQFLCTAELKNFLEVKYACFGVCKSVGTEGKRLLEAPDHFPLLMDKVTLLKNEQRQFRKCYLGLLSGYFSFPVDSASFSQVGTKNGEFLRLFLQKHLQTLETYLPISSWVTILSKHRNLLEHDPCAVYGDELLNGESEAFREACEGLLIPSDSWLRGEAVRAQVSSLCRLNDAAFKERLDHVVSVLMGREGFACSDRIAIGGIASLLKRYALCTSREEHPALRDAALVKIGNPWLHQSAWDSRVGDEDARVMVDGWLKRRLIHDFFSLVAADGLADTRRLNYWLRFADRIEDMWFAFGATARRQTGHDYRVLRERAKGRIVQLESAGHPDNNAFIMRIGGFLLVEFGLFGHACFIFNASDNPFDLTRAWVAGDSQGLKSPLNIKRLLHRDLSTTWEQKFDEEILPRIGWTPPRSGSRAVVRREELEHRTTQVKPVVRSQQLQLQVDGEREARGIPITQQARTETTNTPTKPYTLQYFSRFLQENHMTMEDKRPVGGALWVREAMTTKTDPAAIEQLRAWGFRYKPGKGWWKG